MIKFCKELFNQALSDSYWNVPLSSVIQALQDYDSQKGFFGKCLSFLGFFWDPPIIRVLREAAEKQQASLNLIQILLPVLKEWGELNNYSSFFGQVNGQAVGQLILRFLQEKSIEIYWPANFYGVFRYVTSILVWAHSPETKGLKDANKSFEKFLKTQFNEFILGEYHAPVWHEMYAFQHAYIEASFCSIRDFNASLESPQSRKPFTDVAPATATAPAPGVTSTLFTGAYSKDHTAKATDPHPHQ